MTKQPPRHSVASTSVAAANAKMAQLTHVTGHQVVTVVGDRVVRVPTPSRRALEQAGTSAMQALRNKEAA